MSLFNYMFNRCITLDALYRAYRKAKVDVFYERDLDMAWEFAEYERDLEKNLRSLHKKLLTGDWYKDPEIIGKTKEGVCYTIKSISPEDKNQTGSINTTPKKRWAAYGEWPEIKFRSFCNVPVAYHVVSALWISIKGQWIDRKLSQHSRGSRVRRLTLKSHNQSEGNKNPDYHEHGLGSFEAYIPQYAEWRNKGLQCIKSEFEKKHDVIALTADVKLFFHEIKPGFLLKRPFCHNLEYKDSDKNFHVQFVKSLRAWGARNKVKGLPVGLGASRVIANAFLQEFDHLIETRLSPLYYGRYVDDVFLVIKDSGATNLEGAWKGIMERINAGDPSLPLRLISKTAKNPFAIKVVLSYDSKRTSPDSPPTPRSDIHFTGDKQKAFFLHHLYGKAHLASIERQIREHSSEWRRLPELPDAEDDVDLTFLTHDGSQSEVADALRKADVTSIKRARFAMRLRDLEALAADGLPPQQWIKDREAFANTVCREILETPEVATYAPYFPRILGLAVTTNDIPMATRVIESIKASLNQLIWSTPSKDMSKLSRVQHRLSKRIATTVLRYLPPDLSVAARMEWVSLLGKYSSSSDFAPLASFSFKPAATRDARRLTAMHRRLFLADLAHRPFRECFFTENATAAMRGVRRRPEISDAAWNDMDGNPWWSCRRNPGMDEFCELFGPANFKRGKEPLPLFFPTRPLSFPELSLLASRRGWRKENKQRISGKDLRTWLQALRGTYGRHEDHLLIEDAPKGLPVLRVPIEEKSAKIRIAVTCFEVRDDSYRASVFQVPDHDVDRYKRATRLINSILKLKSEERPHYVIFPELALHERWFMRFALKLQKVGISLISGLDYLPAPGASADPKTPRLINQVRCCLVTNTPGYRSAVFYCQNKEIPAPLERELLAQYRNATLLHDPAVSERMIVQHGGFRFGTLICSEFTDIGARAPFRGAVDSLLIPQWNQDLNSFNALVEASALDLHAFIVQVNNRKYGDSRVRSPGKEEWERDLVRVKGGTNDYFAIAELNVTELRRFQTNAISPEKPFKPVPTGFVIAPSRAKI